MERYILCLHLKRAKFMTMLSLLPKTQVFITKNTKLKSSLPKTQDPISVATIAAARVQYLLSLVIERGTCSKYKD